MWLRYSSVAVLFESFCPYLTIHLYLLVWKSLFEITDYTAKVREIDIFKVFLPVPGGIMSAVLLSKWSTLAT